MDQYVPNPNCELTQVFAFHRKITHVQNFSFFLVKFGLKSKKKEEFKQLNWLQFKNDGF